MLAMAAFSCATCVQLQGRRNLLAICSSLAVSAVQSNAWNVLCMCGSGHLGRKAVMQLQASVQNDRTCCRIVTVAVVDCCMAYGH